MIDVCFTTTNENKKKEVEALLRQHEGLESFNLRLVPLDVAELQGAPDYVAEMKCRTAHQMLEVRGLSTEDTIVMTEDTSLEFRALNGLPGIYIKSFVEAIGNEGLPKLLNGFSDKSAEAKTTFCLYGSKIPNAELFVGITSGKIVEPRGPRKFGWDPNFQPDDSDKTYAEMSAEEKNAVSHRSKAVRRLTDYLADLIREDRGQK